MILILGVVLSAVIHPVDAFSFFQYPITSNDKTQNWRHLVFLKASLLQSTRHVNENGDPFSDLQLSMSAIDGNPTVLYQNATVVDDDEDDGTSEMSSVTHWSDFMRQDAWLQQQVNGEHCLSNFTGSHASESSLTFKLDDSVLSKEELEQIEEYWDRLLPTVNYLGTVQVAKIYKALRVAYLAHRGQMRKSGEPFIVHVSLWHLSFAPCFRFLIFSIYYGDCTAFGGCFASFRSKDGCGDCHGRLIA